MNCEDTRKHLCNGKGPSICTKAEKESVFQHIEGCKSCRAFMFDTLRKAGFYLLDVTDQDHPFILDEHKLEEVMEARKESK